MSEQTKKLLISLVAIELLNCKDKDTDYFKELVKASQELRLI